MNEPGPEAGTGEGGSLWAWAVGSCWCRQAVLKTDYRLFLQVSKAGGVHSSLL